MPTPFIRRLLPLLTVVAVAVTLAVTAVPASAAAPSLTVAADLTATIRLSNCSAALVRFPSSVSTDRAMMLTNGHCYEGGFLAAGQVLQNRQSSRRGTLLSSTGATLGTLTADRVLYATMTGTDITLYRLTRTFASVQSSFGVTA